MQEHNQITLFLQAVTCALMKEKLFALQSMGRIGRETVRVGQNRLLDFGFQPTLPYPPSHFYNYAKSSTTHYLNIKMLREKNSFTGVTITFFFL